MKSSASQPLLTDRHKWPFLGHADLGNHLIHSLESSNLPVVMLFAGPSHVGKKKAARWLVQYDFCQDPLPPCGKCPACRMIISGSHPEVQILTGDSEKSITLQDIRHILHQMNFRATGSNRRWIIIEAIENITASGVSALLKFLEEPPPSTACLLTSSHVRRVPNTILSRAAIFRWHLVPDDELESAGYARNAVHRAAGRPGWLSINQQYEANSIISLLQSLQGQPIPTQWSKPEVSTREMLRLLELVVRDALLTSANSQTRILWPDRIREYGQLSSQSVSLLSVAENIIQSRLTTPAQQSTKAIYFQSLLSI